MTFKEALHIVASDAFIKLAVPSWMMNKVERFRKVETAFSELQVRTRKDFNHIADKQYHKKALYGCYDPGTSNRGESGKS